MRHPNVHQRELEAQCQLNQIVHRLHRLQLNLINDVEFKFYLMIDSFVTSENNFNVKIKLYVFM